MSSKQAASDSILHDDDRLGALRGLDILDTEPEPAFDRVTRLATDLLGTEAALINFVAEDRQWSKSAVGFRRGEADIDDSFCAHVVEQDEALVVENAAEDERFAENPFVTEDDLRFYAGVPLETGGAPPVGTLCVLSGEPRSVSGEALRQLSDLAAIIEGELERRQAHRDLSESREMLRHTQELAGVGGWTYDPQADETIWTDETCRIHGLPPGTQASLEEVLTFYDDESRSALKSHVERLLEEGGRYDLELRIETAEGERRQVRALGEAHRDDGETTRIDGAVQDITERQRTRRELAEQTETLQAVLDHAPVMITLAEDGELEMVNDHVESVLGWAEEDLGSPADLLERCYPDPEVRQDVMDTIEEAPDEWRDFRPRRADGTRVDTTWRNVSLSNGRTIGFGVDISERKERERDREQRYEAIFNQTYQFAGLMEPDGTLIEANETALAFGGLDPADVIGKPFWEADWWQINDETQQEVREATRRAADGEFVRYEVDVQGEDDIITIDFSIRPVTDEDGDVKYLIPEGRDITDLKVLQRQKRELERYERIIENLPVGVLRTTPAGELAGMNSAFASLFGADSMEELRGYSAQDLWADPADRDALLETAQEKGLVEEKEVRLQTLDGEARRMEVTLALTETEQGKTVLYGILWDVTEERERKATLRRQKNLLEQTQRLAGAWMADLRTDEVTWSEEGYRIHELDPNVEITLEKGFELLHPEALPEVRAAFERCVEAGEPYDLEHPIVTAEGNRRWVRTVGAPVEVEGEEVVKVAGAFQDITDRKEAEQELRQSQERLQMAIEGGNIGTWNWDLETDTVHFNHRWAEMLGYTREELDFHFSTWEDLVHPEDLDRALDELEAYIYGETDTYAPEIRMQTKAGEWKWVQTIGKVIDRDDDGHATRAAGIHLDISERKETERRLRMLSQAVEQANDAVLITEAAPLNEPGPRIVYVNEAFEEMTGYAEEEVLGETPRLLQGPETDRAALDEIRKALKAGGTWEGETTNYRKDGRPYLPRWNLAPVTSEDGTIEYWVSVQRDITEEKRREEELRRQKALLEQTQKLAGGWEVDLETGEVSLTETVRRIYGTAPSAASGDTEFGDMELEDAFEGFAPEAQPKIREAFRRCAREGTPYDLELPFVTAEGERKHVRTVGAPAETRDGEIVKVAGALQDITARTEAVRELRRSRERYRSLFRDSSDAILVHDLDGIIREANPEAEWLFGLDVRELRGTSVAELRASAETGTAREKLSALRKNGAYEAVSRYEQADGSVFWAEVSASTAEIGDEFVARTLIRDVTERVESRQELEQYRAYTSQMLGAIDDLFFELDEEGRIQRWNDRVPAVTGYAEAEIEEMTAFDLVPDSEEERVAAKIADGFEEGHVQIVVPLVCRDGTTIPYELVGNLVQHPSGALRAVGIGRDITERRRRKRKLERQNDLFAKAQDLASVGAWEYDVQSGEDLGTDEVYRIYGLSPEADFTLEQSIESYHPDDRPTIREAFRRAVENGEPYDVEARLITQDGEERWVRTRGEPQREGGEVARVRGTIQDVTAQKEMEQELREMKEFYEQVFSQIPIDLAIFDRQGRFVMINGSSVSDPEHRKQILGTTNEEYFRKQGLDPEVGRRRDDAIQEARETGEPTQIEETLQPKERPVHYLRVHGPVTNPEGEITHVVGYGVDLTNRKEAERKLREAKEEAEEADRIKTALLSNLNHELRTPLTSIITFSELISEDPDIAGRFVDRILGGGERLLYTLDTVMSFAELEGEGTSATPKPTHPEEVLRSVVNGFREQAERKGVDLSVEIPERVGITDLDEHLVDQVLTHLVHNAVKFTDEGAVTASVRRLGEGVEFQIEDTGVGIDPDFLPQVFDEFAQQSSGYDRTYEGNGLGLTVARRLTREMGGTIDIESEPEEGTVVTVRLPAED